MVFRIVQLTMALKESRCGCLGTTFLIRNANFSLTLIIFGCDQEQVQNEQLCLGRYATSMANENVELVKTVVKSDLHHSAVQRISTGD